MYKLKNKPNNDIFNASIDLRKQTHGLIKEFGINMLYVRNNKFVKCSCFNDLNKQGDSKCKLCFGSGFFSSIELVKSMESSNSAYSSTNTITNTSIGQTEQKNEIYYLEYNKIPNPNDYLLKVTWKNGYPVDVVQVLEIAGLYDMRADNGRTELYGCIVNQRTDKMLLFQSALTALRNTGIKEVLKGGTYIWPYKILN